MEHSELVAEMPHVERLSVQERLHLARRRRMQQLRAWSQREKEWMKRQQQQRQGTGNKRRIFFDSSVVLLEAAARNDINEVRALLQKGVDPDATNEDGLTALHQCCIDDNEEMLLLLLEHGANVNAEDSEKWTPLHAAATCGHLHLVRVLVSHGANLLAVNADGNMPYDICEDEPALDYIEAEMARRGVTQELIDETRASTELQMLRELQDVAARGCDLELKDEIHGATPLHIASANGYLRVVDFLLDHHVSTDPKDKDDWQPVHAAACWGHLEVLEALVQAGADLNAKNKHDETPSDICEDPELRERILQLRSEQESKRAQEARRRGVRRSQSNNTRTQSVRRTSIREKILTSKKEAVEEARLRLQQPRDGSQTATTPTDNPPAEPRVPDPGTAVAIRRAPEGSSAEDENKSSAIEVPTSGGGTEASYTAEGGSQKINIHVSVTINAGTLADLKKQRAQIRSNTATPGSTEVRPASPVSLHPAKSLVSPDTKPSTAPATPPTLVLTETAPPSDDEVLPVNKFSGDTSEVVSDVMRTPRRCNIL